jgi:SAM-dependent methyltransferase
VTSFLLSNTEVAAIDRLDALAWTYDAASRRVLAGAGVTAGWRCWEVGAGSGSVAAWLAERVGSAGSVLVTDIDLRWLGEVRDRENVTVLRHDVVRDELPAGEFDLIHARAVLLHLPQRQLVLDRLIGCLRPGGWLVVEDLDGSWTPVLAAPSRNAAELFNDVHGVFLDVLRLEGVDPGWGRALFAAFNGHGLVDVRTSAHAMAWPGAGRGIGLHRVNFTLMAERLCSAGITEAQLTDLLALLDDPAFAVQSYALVSAVGRTRDA